MVDCDENRRIWAHLSQYCLGFGQARCSIPKGVAFGKVVCDTCLYCIRIPHLVNVEVGSTPSNVS